MILGCVLAVPAVVAYWLHNEVTNSDSYLAAVAPLSGDPAVRQAVSARVTSAIMNKVDTSQRTSLAVQTVVSAAESAEAAGVIYDAFTRFLKRIVRWTFGIAAALAIGTFVLLRTRGERMAAIGSISTQCER